MTSSETKIELITEAIETLVLASVTATLPNAKAAAHQNVLDARKVLKDALKLALAPTLRVVSSEGERYLSDRTMGDQMMGCGS